MTMQALLKDIGLAAVSISVASLAALSANSLPGTFEWPGNHWMIVLPVLSWIDFLIGAVSMLKLSKAWHRDWLSVQIKILSSGLMFVDIQLAVTFIASTSSSYEHVKTDPFCLMVCIISGFSGSPFVIMTAEPPFLVPSVSEPSVYIVMSAFTSLILVMDASFFRFNVILSAGYPSE